MELQLKVIGEKPIARFCTTAVEFIRTIFIVKFNASGLLLSCVIVHSEVFNINVIWGGCDYNSISSIFTLYEEVLEGLIVSKFS